MVVFGTRMNGDRRRRSVPAGEGAVWKAEWMESGDDPVLSPTASLIEQPPDMTLPAHFHRNNQFQLFVDGSGRIGRNPIAGLTVHYAGAYTGYGPLVAGPEGLKYFTIRPVCESGLVLASDRSQMLHGPKRHMQSAQVSIKSVSELRTLAQIIEKDLIPAEPDGLAAKLVSVPPNESFTGAHVPNSQGQFIFVMSGTVRCDGAELQEWESLFVSSDEQAPTLTAGTDGAEFVALSAPFKDVIYQQADDVRSDRTSGRGAVPKALRAGGAT